MALLFTPDIGTSSKPQVKDLDSTFDEIVSIEEVQEWVQQWDTEEKETLDSLRIAAIRMLEKNYNISLSIRNRTAYYYKFGAIVNLFFSPHVSITEVRVNDEITTDYTENGFTKKILTFGYKGNHLEVDFNAGSEDQDLKRAVLMQVKYMYDGQWDDEETISPEIDKILMPYASIY